MGKQHGITMSDSSCVLQRLPHALDVGEDFSTVSTSPGFLPPIMLAKKGNTATVNAPPATKIEAVCCCMSSESTASPVTATMIGSPVAEYNPTCSCSRGCMMPEPVDVSTSRTYTGSPRVSRISAGMPNTLPGLSAMVCQLIAIPDTTKILGST